jgi:hypothetical protein
MVADAQTVKVEVADPPDASVTLVTLRLALSPVDETDAVRETVPEKPLTLLTVMIVEISHPPRGTVTLEWFDEMVKSGVGLPLLKVAVCTLSGTGFGVPFAMLMHKGGLLVCVPHPVWKPRLVPELVPVIL